MSHQSDFEKGNMLVQEILTSLREFLRLVSPEDRGEDEQVLIEYLLETHKHQEELTLCKGRVMGIHLHQWLKVQVGQLVWLIDVACPNTKPRPVVMLPGSPLQMAYLEG